MGLLLLLGLLFAAGVLLGVALAVQRPALRPTLLLYGFPLLALLSAALLKLYLKPA